VNLLHGVPRGETTVASVAGAGSSLLEFHELSRASGNPIFGAKAAGAMRGLWSRRSSLGYSRALFATKFAFCFVFSKGCAGCTATTSTQHQDRGCCLTAESVIFHLLSPPPSPPLLPLSPHIEPARSRPFRCRHQQRQLHRVSRERSASCSQIADCTGICTARTQICLSPQLFCCVRRAVVAATACNASIPSRLSVKS
jgi:hypothetical protein